MQAVSKVEGEQEWVWQSCVMRVWREGRSPVRE